MRCGKMHISWEELKVNPLYEQTYDYFWTDVLLVLNPNFREEEKKEECRNIGIDYLKEINWSDVKFFQKKPDSNK
ncbi:MAG: hypothetical protein ACXWFZ_12245 [Nitrososphaeraceae archaeon]